MADLDLTELLQNKLGKKYRKVGRYSVSDLYAIQARWLTPETWLHPEPVDFTGLMNMLSGIIIHEKVQMLYPKECCEIKMEFKYKDIVLVGKCDYLPKESEEIIDFKTSKQIIEKKKPWSAHQIKMYCTMFERRKGILYQPIIKNQKLILKDVGQVERDDVWFMKEVEKLYQFHLKVVDLAIKEGLIKEYVPS